MKQGTGGTGQPVDSIRGPDVARMLNRPIELAGALLSDATTDAESVALAEAISLLARARVALRGTKFACVTWMGK